GSRRKEGQGSVAVADLEPLVARDLADARALELPALEDALDVGLTPRARDDEHPLLRLREHHLERRHAAGASGHPADVDAHADAALRRDLARRAREPRGAEVLHGLDRVDRDELERRLEEELLDERVPHLHGRPLAVVTGTELERGQQRRARDAVAAGI